jgi:hypothetical protein
MNKVEAEISIGELVDKITILKIKKINIKDKNKLSYVKNELKVLLNLYRSNVKKTNVVKSLEIDLMSVNQKLWTVEDKLRILESKKLFNKNFILLARSVYKLNDKRARIKNKINMHTLSSIVEVKSYQKYS